MRFRKGEGYWLGKKRPEISGKNNPMIKYNIPNPMKNKSVVEKQKIKIRGDKNGKWKGGKALSKRRERAKRRKLGNEYLNQPFKGSEGHHINKNQIFFIPAWLHKSFFHSTDKPKTMERINVAAWLWILFNEDAKQTFIKYPQTNRKV
jgi:hypothetical protein